MNTHLRGRKSEQVASEFLEQLGYSIVSRNYFSRFGEVDIIALDKATTVFVEVKSLGLKSGFSVYETITPSKLHRIKKTINYWMINNPSTGVWRLDFLGIISHNGFYCIDHIQNI